MSDTLTPDQLQAAVDKASKKLRQANLLEGLALEGFTGVQAKGIARLLDVEYDEIDEPTNLQYAIKAAKARYGEEMFKLTPVDSKSEDSEVPSLTTDQLAAAKAAGMTPEEYVQWGGGGLSHDEESAAKASGMSLDEYREWAQLGHMGTRESNELRDRLLDREEKQREKLKAQVRAQINGGEAA